MSDRPTPAELAEPTADLLDAAAARLAEHGHCKGVTRELDGRSCALGAIQTVGWRWNMFVTRNAVKSLYNTLTSFSDAEDEAYSIATWNDHPDTTADDVITTMQKAAIGLREKVQ